MKTKEKATPDYPNIKQIDKSPEAIIGYIDDLYSHVNLLAGQQAKIMKYIQQYFIKPKGKK